MTNPETVTVRRGDTVHTLRVPTPEQLNAAVIDAAMAVGALQGIADGLEPREDVGHVASAIRDIAANVQRFVELVDPDGMADG
jgi:hypothetical protein